MKAGDRASSMILIPGRGAIKVAPSYTDASAARAANVPHVADGGLQCKLRRPIASTAEEQRD
jgi:hypothetical protein